MSKPTRDELQFISISADEEDGNMMAAPETTYNENSSVIGSWILKQSKHPSAIILHLIFKAAALFMYIFGSWFTTSFIFTFVICIILLAFDFWVVKNISGRLLVGLRWWSYVREDGSNDWIFESLEVTIIINYDSNYIVDYFYFTLSLTLTLTLLVVGYGGDQPRGLTRVLDCTVCGPARLVPAASSRLATIRFPVPTCSRSGSQYELGERIRLYSMLEFGEKTYGKSSSTRNPQHHTRSHE